MKNGRRGASLIELVVVMTLMAVIVSVSVGAISLFMRAEGKGAESLSEATAWMRLAREFRRDVHASRSALLLTEKEEQDRAMELISADNIRIVYRANGDGIERVSSREDEVQRSEHFRLKGGTIHFGHDEESGLARLDWRRHDDGDDQTTGAMPTDVWSLAAVVGLDHLPPFSQGR